MLFSFRRSISDSTESIYKKANFCYFSHLTSTSSRKIFSSRTRKTERTCSTVKISTKEGAVYREHFVSRISRLRLKVSYFPREPCFPLCYDLKSSRINQSRRHFPRAPHYLLVSIAHASLYSVAYSLTSLKQFCV